MFICFFWGGGRLTACSANSVTSGRQIPCHLTVPQNDSDFWQTQVTAGTNPPPLFIELRTAQVSEGRRAGAAFAFPTSPGEAWVVSHDEWKDLLRWLCLDPKAARGSYLCTGKRWLLASDCTFICIGLFMCLCVCIHLFFSARLECKCPV